MKEDAGFSDFVRYLNRSYWINSHLIERLDELNGAEPFASFQKVIGDTLVLLELHLSQTEKLFGTLKTSSSMSGSEQAIAFLESVFTQILKAGTNSPQLCLLDYVSVADCLMLESSKLAQLSIVNFAKSASLQEYQLYNPMLLQQLKEVLEINESPAVF